jgi:hypothetical protein
MPEMAPHRHEAEPQRQHGQPRRRQNQNQKEFGRVSAQALDL